MALTNTELRYGAVTKTFHWLTALLILSLIPLGWYANQLPFDTSEELARKAWLFSLHKTLGVAVFFVALGRIAWALSQPKPGLLNADHKAESFAAELVHWLLYGALVIVPLSGWIGHAAAEGFAPIWWPFGQNLPLVPKSTDIEHIFGALHWAATRVLIGAVLLHIAGALKHHVIDRDPTLRRMLPGEAAIGQLPAQHHSRLPGVAALLIWAATVGYGVMLGLPGQTDSDAPAALAEVASDWQVEEGSIEITVMQFGSEVTGSFADWTASISLDETIPDGPAGQAEVTISIASLALGSVTQQALGPDFFDATAHPTAVFSGPILRVADGYELQGTLRIKDKSMPVTLPFSLSLDQDKASALGRTTLDRRDFSIGDNMGDEASLGFSVAVKVNLTAQRTAQ
ncbi:MAG: cytochrome b/b6 domain-containing protein [Sulfitobacter sp.]